MTRFRPRGNSLAALVLSLSRDAPVRATGASSWIILQDAALCAAPQDEVAGCDSPNLAVTSREKITDPLSKGRGSHNRRRAARRASRAAALDAAVVSRGTTRTPTEDRS